ncbi:swi5-dependent recombination DNA repair protein 1 homolog isoform X2 [Patella vulgata]|nr:swi5-dependent recombination DNA repair protein 1 homolog isoform X2 [Patella vulgata]XP_050397607.1 swi5-dependent recombination DNA repair protein 1 homolog isoform X2 [Patella vulgata]XP_050397609.1 swi5-dependent recombination DNA repair protein 1 homolog isoform X2 [Patella vulgata]
MSSALKERLKRCGRYHISTPSPKRICGKSVHQLENEECTATSDNLSSVKCLSSSVDIVKKQITPSRFTSPLPNIQTLNVVTSSTSCSVKLSSPLSSSFTSPLPNNRTPNVPSLISCSGKLSSRNTPLPKKNYTPVLKCRKLDLISNNINSSVIKESTIGDIVKNDVISLQKQLKDLQKELQEKEENLRKLEMVKMYRKKNDLTHLTKLITKWRQVSQDALQDFQSMLPAPQPTMAEVIQHLQIDPQLINFNSEEDTFD